MGLIHNDQVVGAQQRIGLGLGQQNPVCHQFYGNPGASTVIESNLVAHLGIGAIPALAAKFLRNSLGDGHRRQPSRLGMGDCFTLCPSAHSEPDLGKLGGFARSCLSADNNHRMLLDRQCDILPSGTDREVFRELNLH